MFSKRSQSENATYYTIPTKWHSRKDKTIENKKTRLLGARDKWVGRFFRAVKLFITLQWWIPVNIHLTIPNQWTTICNLWTLGDNDVLFIGRNKCTDPVWDLILAEAVFVVWQGWEVYGSPLVTAPSCCELKTALKYKGLFVCCAEDVR